MVARGLRRKTQAREDDVVGGRVAHGAREDPQRLVRVALLKVEPAECAERLEFRLTIAGILAEGGELLERGRILRGQLDPLDDERAGDRVAALVGAPAGGAGEALSPDRASEAGPCEARDDLECFEARQACVQRDLVDDRLAIKARVDLVDAVGGMQQRGQLARDGLEEQGVIAQHTGDLAALLDARERAFRHADGVDADAAEEAKAAGFERLVLEAVAAFLPQEHVEDRVLNLSGQHLKQLALVEGTLGDEVIERTCAVAPAARSDLRIQAAARRECLDEQARREEIGLGHVEARFVEHERRILRTVA